MTTPKDTDIREALRRKYANVPQMRSPLRLPRGGEKKRFPLHRWWFPASAVAASIIVAFFLWPNSPAVVEQPVVAEVVEQPTPEVPAATDYSEVSENSGKSEPSELVKPKRTYKVRKPQDDPVLAEAELVIPADKQALVDIYLAEEALQVAYELQAQQEELRAFAASLTGAEEEPQPQPIIAF
jgi:hypothetical protein